ncbi:hypothetical protein [Nesterenkonia pannonica]|uniref:hypothetical protein n=1 Tax=Nesterenkonia pannonica TaxID=1548602 RepID=UPI002164D232|nr:hypothetical protein [Nesterenkonia pannonica]
MSDRAMNPRKAAAALLVSGALLATACAPGDAEFEEDTEASDNGEAQTDTSEDTAADGTESDQAEESPEAEPESGSDDDEAASDQNDEETPEENGAQTEEDVRAVAQFLTEEYPEGVIGQLENEGGYFEVEIFDLASGMEYEFDLDPESFDMWDYDEETLDGDDQQKAESAEISFLDALETAENEA